jgi:hypothetical protein
MSAQQRKSTRARKTIMREGDALVLTTYGSETPTYAVFSGWADCACTKFHAQHLKRTSNRKDGNSAALCPTWTVNEVLHIHVPADVVEHKQIGWDGDLAVREWYKLGFRMIDGSTFVLRSEENDERFKHVEFPVGEEVFDTQFQPGLESDDERLDDDCEDDHDSDDNSCAGDVARSDSEYVDTDSESSTSDDDEPEFDADDDEIAHQDKRARTEPSPPLSSGSGSAETGSGGSGSAETGSGGSESGETDDDDSDDETLGGFIVPDNESDAFTLAHSDQDESGFVKETHSSVRQYNEWAPPPDTKEHEVKAFIDLMSRTAAVNDDNKHFAEGASSAQPTSYERAM